MNNDIAIEYNAKKIEVNDNIKQLETLGIKVKKYTEAIEKIEMETNLAVKKCYDNYNKIDSNFFLSDFLIEIYGKAIKSLNKINDHITDEYESYYKIQSKCNKLNKQSEKVDDTNIDDFSQSVLSLLSEIRKSTTIDYEEEKNIIENIYKLVYKSIKLELIYTNDSLILESIKSDISDVTYISQLIKEDIKQTIQKEKNKELKEKLQEIDQKGFKDIYYLDKELILLVCTIGNEKLMIKKRINFFNN